MQYLNRYFKLFFKKNDVQTFLNFHKDNKGINPFEINQVVFLDSNALLYYYLGMSESEKDIFHKFLDKTIDNTFLTYETENEFIQKLIFNYENNYQKINCEDPLFKRLNEQIKKTSRLPFEKITIIQKDYDYLLNQEYDSFKDFPQFLEIEKNKINRGDYFIFHEIIETVNTLENSTNQIIFLTYSETNFEEIEDYTPLEFIFFKATSKLLKFVNINNKFKPTNFFKLYH